MSRILTDIGRPEPGLEEKYSRLFMEKQMEIKRLFAKANLGNIYIEAYLRRAEEDMIWTKKNTWPYVK